jgi:hypothetical protein
MRPAATVPGNNAAQSLRAVADRAVNSGADFHIEPQESRALEAVLGLAIVDAALESVNLPPRQLSAAA